MLAKKCFLLGIFTLLSMSLAISAQPVHPTTGEPLVIDCLRGTPDAIDGDLSDWNLEAMTPAVLDAVEQLNFGQENWTGPEDCSGEFYLLWDDVNIYIAVVVKDEKLSMNKTGGDIWNADAVEIFFATTDAEAEHSWTNPTIHYQYGINANNQKWNWCNMHGPGQSEPDYLQIASSVTADGYICEASIEYGQMLSLDFSAGNTIGFHAVLDDTDNGDAELQMTWTGLPAHDQSMGYGHMLLSSDSMPEPEPEPANPGAEGLVAHYAFENDTADSSGSGLNGTAIGDPTFAAGVEGMALDLNGNDYLDCGGVAEFSFSDAMTVSTWVNIRSHTAAWMAIVAKGENAWRLGVNNTTTGIHYAFSGGGRGWQAANTATELAFDEWYHVAATYDTTVGAIVYINGVPDASNPDIGGIDINQFSMLIGENPEATGRLFDGMLDEIMLYNRALSEAEIRFLAGERAPYVYDGDVLDDTWNHDNNSDAWDGTGIGEGSPGGVSTLVEDSVTFLRVQETGDPRDYGMPDPSNRKIYLTQQIDYGLDGSSVEFRIRVATTPPLDDLHPDGGAGIAPWPEGGIGYHIRDGGKGMVGIAEAGVGQISFSLAKAGEIAGLETDALVMNGLLGNVMSADVDTGDAATPNIIPIADATAWNTVTVDIAAGGAGTHVVTVCVNEECMVVELTAGASMDGVNNYIAFGSSGTGANTAFDVDYVKVNFTPEPEPIVNLVLNPSFEEDEDVLDDPTWYSWATWNPAEGAGSNATIVDTDAADGARSLLIEPVGIENWHFIVLSLPIPTEVGAGYTASFKAKAAEARPLGVQFKSTDNTVQWGYTDFQLTTEWAEYSLTADALNAETKLEFFCAGVGVAFSLDSVAVYKVSDAPPAPEEEVPPPAPGVNQLGHGGFEDGPATPLNTWAPKEWSMYGEGCSMEVVSEGAIEGAYCLKVTVPAATTDYWSLGFKQGGHVFVKDRSYTLSAWMKSNSGPLSVNLKLERDGGDYSGTEQMANITEEWAQYSVTTPVYAETVDPAAATFHIGHAAGEFLVDDIQLYEN